MTQAAQWILMRIWIHIFLRMKLGGIQQGDLDGKYTDMEQDQVFIFSLSIPALTMCT
jgi:hypothetical protein